MQKAEDKRAKTPFGLRMSAARRAVKPRLTQEVAAEKIGIRQSTLSELESTALGTTHVAKFAALYGVNSHWLETGDGPMRAETGAPPPPKPTKNFEDPRVVTPSQWALLQAVEMLMPETQRADIVAQWRQARERILADLKATATARGMSIPMGLDELPDQTGTSKKAAKK